jgi:hypothetical protein
VGLAACVRSGRAAADGVLRHLGVAADGVIQATARSHP